METNSYAKQLLQFVFLASKGGINRIRIVSQLRDRPFNAYQLSLNLELNYKAIQHHLRVLERNNLVIRIGGKYGAAFFISPLLEANFGTFDKMAILIDRKVALQTYSR